MVSGFVAHVLCLVASKAHTHTHPCADAHPKDLKGQAFGLRPQDVRLSDLASCILSLDRSRIPLLVGICCRARRKQTQGRQSPTTPNGLTWSLYTPRCNRLVAQRKVPQFRRHILGQGCSMCCEASCSIARNHGFCPRCRP